MKLHASLAMLVALAAGPTAVAGFESPDAQSFTPDGERARPWQLSARAFFGYNDNVQLVPDSTFFTGDRSDSFAGASLVGSYRLYQDEAVSIFAVGELSQLFYLGNAAGGGGSSNDYDLTVLSPGLLANVNHQLFGYDAVGSVRYTYRHEADRDVDAIGLSSHGIALAETLMLTRQTALTAGFTYADDNYEVDFPTPATDDRDADRYALSLGIKHRWANNRRNVSFDYTYSDTDAEGSNFDYDAHAITGRFETHLIAGLWGALELGYSDADYGGFVSGFIPAPGRTEQQAFHFTAQFIYVIDARWSVDVAYTFKEYSSNQPQFESEVNQFAVGLTYKF